MIVTTARPSHLGRKYSEASRIAKLWYPRPKHTESIRDNPQLQERLFQLLEYGYSVKDLFDWFRLDRINIRAATNTAEANVIWEDIKAFYGYKCAYCGRKTSHLTKDHIIAISKGGRDTMGNIVPACSTCNHKKNARDLLNWSQFNKLQLHLLTTVY